MKKKIVILIFFTLAVINAIVAGFRICDIGRKTELLAIGLGNIRKLENSLYDITSLNTAISKLEKEVSAAGALKRKDDDYSTLRMTEEVLLLFEKNRIKVISYRLEGEENREELALTAEGKISGILKFIYDLSYSDSRFRINFVRVDARFPGQPATIVIRIAYA